MLNTNTACWRSSCISAGWLVCADVALLQLQAREQDEPNTRTSHTCSVPLQYVCHYLLQLQAEDLDERNVAELRKFDAAVALEILEHYSQADFSTVRNRRAYLAGAACFVMVVLQVFVDAVCWPPAAASVCTIGCSWRACPADAV